MSFFGKNIKKIRSIKSLSQQSFADLFDLKRGTLGAYEEERSEPRIETIIKIANYFSISIDDLLTSELTVNKLLKFKGEITTMVDEAKKDHYAKVPCISLTEIENYIANHSKSLYIANLPFLRLPVNDQTTYRGLTISNLEMTNHDKGFYPNDIVIGELIPQSDIQKINNGSLVFVVLEDAIIFRKGYTTKDAIILRADHKGAEDIQTNIANIKELWQIRFVFCKRIPEFSDNIEDQLVLIQNELSKIKERL